MGQHLQPRRPNRLAVVNGAPVDGAVPAGAITPVSGLISAMSASAVISGLHPAIR